MFLLGILDFLFVSHAYHSILTRGASVQLVFGFEVKLAWEVGRTGLRWHCTCLQSLHKPLLSTCSVANLCGHQGAAVSQSQPCPLHTPKRVGKA